MGKRETELAQPAGDLEAIEVGEHHVEQDNVGTQVDGDVNDRVPPRSQMDGSNPS